MQEQELSISCRALAAMSWRNCQRPRKRNGTDRCSRGLCKRHARLRWFLTSIVPAGFSFLTLVWGLKLGLVKICLLCTSSGMSLADGSSEEPRLWRQSLGIRYRRIFTKSFSSEKCHEIHFRQSHSSILVYSS